MVEQRFFLLGSLSLWVHMQESACAIQEVLRCMLSRVLSHSSLSWQGDDDGGEPMEEADGLGETNEAEAEGEHKGNTVICLSCCNAVQVPLLFRQRQTYGDNVVMQTGWRRPAWLPHPGASG